MSSRNTTHLLSFALVVIALSLGACTKEELVQPCSDQGGSAKVLSVLSEDVVVPAEAIGAKNGDGDLDGTGISDDGDDLSGSERNKKKRTN